MRKLVHFDLGDNLGDMLPLLADLASFLESATDELATAPDPTAMSSQCHDIPAGGDQPKKSTAASRKSMAASWAPTNHPALPDLVESPLEWVWAYIAKRGDHKMVVRAQVPRSRATQQGPGARISWKAGCRL